MSTDLFTLFKMLYRRLMQFVPFAQYFDCEIYPCHYLLHYHLPLHCCVVFHCINILQFIISYCSFNLHHNHVKYVIIYLLFSWIWCSANCLLWVTSPNWFISNLNLMWIWFFCRSNILKTFSHFMSRDFTHLITLYDLKIVIWVQSKVSTFILWLMLFCV